MPNPASDRDLTELISKRVAEAAASDNVDAALLQLADLFPRIGELDAPTNRSGGQVPPTRLAVLLALLASAMNRSGHSSRVEGLLRSVGEAYWPKRPRESSDSGLDRLTHLYPFLLVPLVDAALASGDPEWALRLMANVQGPAWGASANWFKDDEFIAEVLEHKAVAARLSRLPSDAWILNRMLATRAVLADGAALDFSKDRNVDFDTRLLRAALTADESAMAVSVVEEHLGERARLLRLCNDHLGFNCMLVLADVGRQDEAFALAKDIVRHGYSMFWRFNLEGAVSKPWTQAMRQNECLKTLAGTEAYRSWFDAELRYIAPSKGDPLTFSHVSEGTWGGKKTTKCALTRVPIAPGEAVVRVRRYLDPVGPGKVENASVSAFEEGPAREAREQFEGFAMPLDRVFPDPRRVRAHWGNSDVAAFAYDLSFDLRGARTGGPGGGPDLERAAMIIASASPPRPRFLWTDPAAPQGWREAFPPFAQDRGYGDPVTLLWRLWRAGFGQQVIQRVAALDAPLADKAMAMVGTFNDPALRDAAAEHFGIQGLPETMDLAFKPRLKLDEHRTLADFGQQHPRYRAGMVAAMGAYGLHLYNTGGATVDWYLDGLEHYTSGHGSQLLYLLLHSPGEDDVLREMLRRELLPRDTSVGGYGYYGDTKSMYYRAACLHLAWHDPARLGVWQSGWIAEKMTRSYDRATHKLLASALK